MYSTNSTLAFNLNQYSSYDDTIQAIENITYPGGGTFTGQALNYAVTRLFNSSIVRVNISQVLVVITDGVSTDDVTAHASFLPSTLIYVNGIGKNYELAELKQISERVFTGDFNNLQEVANSVRAKMCLGN